MSANEGIAPNKTTRELTLDTAKNLVMGDRNKDYSDPSENFRMIAGLWSRFTGRLFTPEEVAVMMILVKVSRLSTSPAKLDNWIDIAGYAACGAETAALRVVNKEDL